MLDYLQHHWLALSLTLIGVTLPVLLRRWLLVGLACSLLGVGSLTLPSAWGLGILIAAGGLLLFMLFIVVASGKWSAPLGYIVAGLLMFGLGSWCDQAVAAFLIEAGRFLLSLGVDDPWWLLGLLLVPLIIWVSHGRLTGLGPVRRWIAVGLRCLLVVFLCLALAEVHARQVDRDVTVLFVIDRSLSIPPDFGDGKDQDLRPQRLFRFINQAVSKRGPGREGDRTGVIVFGRYPRIELPPARVGQLPLKEFHSVIDPNYTDIAAALKLALASFPEGSSRRIVLVSDGNENLGNALEQAKLAKRNGVEIDVVAVEAGRRNYDEVLVERVEAPALSDEKGKIPLRVILRSYHPGIVTGDLTILRKRLEKHTVDGKIVYLPEPKEVVFDRNIELHQGLNVRSYSQKGLETDEAVSYEAVFVPHNLPRDRVDNNRASTTVVAHGQRAILLIESVNADDKNGDHRLLIERLNKGGGLNVVPLRSDILPREPARLAMILNKFDCVILANVPADELSEVQQSVIRSNTHEQGAGLVMIGGPQSFGAGGWQDTELEKALPVTCDNKSTRVDVRGGLVLIMHASEMLDGNAWQKKVAKLAIEKLAPVDMVGVTNFAQEGHAWHIKFGVVGQDRSRLFRQVDSLNPGDMPDLGGSLAMARAELNKKEYELGTKHVIFISDGDTTFPGDDYLAKLGLDDGITLSTVCITSHGAGEVARMKEIVEKVVTKSGKKGHSYHPKDPRELPAIYVKETRIVSQSYVYQKEFEPQLVRRDGPAANLQIPLPPLHGFVRTTPRPTRLVEVPIETPKLGDDEFPVLACWNYGLGRSVAFTSDARSRPEAQFWDRDWAGSKQPGMYTQFWKQVIDWARRPDDNREKFLAVTTDQRQGKVRVVVEALDPATKMPITTVELQPGVTALSFKEKEARKVDLKFEQKSPGIYEAEFQADEVGSYLLNVKGTWPERKLTESVRAGVTIPYSPEFAEMESKPELLRKLAELTGGKFYEEKDEVLERAAASGELFRPVPTNQRTLQPLWFMLVLLTGIGMFLDVAVRRISIEPAAVAAQMKKVWASLRGSAAAETTVDPFMERLKSRKAQVDDALAKEQATRRFEGDQPPSGDGGPALPKEAPLKSKTPPSVAPEKEKEADDYASRLMRAKKRAQEDRDKK